MSTPEPAADSVILKPWEDENWGQVFRWYRHYWDMIADDTVPTDEILFIESMLMQRPEVRFGVYYNGELGGVLTLNHLSPWICDGHCAFKKGIDAQHWNRAVRLEGVRKGIEFAFKAGYHKVLCCVFENNAPMRRMLDEMGAEQEGFRRDQTIQHGRWVNMVDYGIFRDTWKEV